ncbi:MAG TPA: rhomboid family intramembrane serine protease [Ignavibacteriaceae bacterium]|nr:rhomboid family intramembrane serine protease [Ignavibacteriaceae bacterium]
MSNYHRPGFGGFSVFPPVIKNLMIINVAIFFIQILGNEIIVSGKTPLSQVLIQYFALIPIGTFADASFYPWQLITYQFMHGGFGHIFFNMFALWMFGMEIENMWGPKKFLLFYLGSGVVAGLCHLFISPLLGASPAPTIGASGAVYAVLIGFALFFPNRYIFLYFLIPVKAKYLIGFLIVFEFLAINSAHSNIAHLAHLGGALTGFLFIWFDKSSHIDLKAMIRRNRFKQSASSGSVFDIFTKSKDVQEAKYYDIKDSKEDKLDVTQEEIDRILDKISQSGYENLTAREKKILFEASKK